MQDGFSRFLFECRGMLRLDLEPKIRSFRRLFRTYGLPARIRTDNGHPFSSIAIAALSQLSVWWISLGIQPELIEPGKPQQNGRHEPTGGDSQTGQSLRTRYPSKSPL